MKSFKKIFTAVVIIGFIVFLLWLNNWLGKEWQKKLNQSHPLLPYPSQLDSNNTPKVPLGIPDNLDSLGNPKPMPGK